MSDTLDWTILLAILGSAIRLGCPVAFAALGEMITERSGVINLGLEGMMLVGAATAVAIEVGTGDSVIAVLAAGVAAATLSSIHGLVAVWLNGNQIVSGLALSILGTGLSGYFGRPYVGVRVDGIQTSGIPLLERIPLVGDVLFGHDPLVYLALVAAMGTSLIFARTRFGLHLRAVGHDPQSAYAQGIAVRRVRFSAVLIGGFLAGIGGAQLALAHTYLWAEQMTAGQGWIAVGVVVVARWRTWPVLLAAFGFGALAALNPHLQAAGIRVSSYLVGMLPYLAAATGLALVTMVKRTRTLGAPAALAKGFSIEGR